jgi:uncharacterized RDD family membrane protein YckC
VHLDLPEHGQLQLPLAGMGRRGVAALVDLALLAFFGLFVVVAAAVLAGSTGMADLVGPGAIGLTFLLPVGGPLLFELVQSGQTPGKRMLDLRVISADGTPASAGQLFLRNVVRLVDFLPFGYFVGLVATFSSKRTQRLGDLVAATLVIREDAQALVELGLTSHTKVSQELHGIPEAVLRGARLLLDPMRDIEQVARHQRESEVAALVRRYRPDLVAESDEAIWTRLRRALGQPA